VNADGLVLFMLPRREAPGMVQGGTVTVARAFVDESAESHSLQLGPEALQAASGVTPASLSMPASHYSGSTFLEQFSLLGPILANMLCMMWKLPLCLSCYEDPQAERPCSEDPQAARRPCAVQPAITFVHPDQNVEVLQP
jgi:hypothetical protein